MINNQLSLFGVVVAIYNKPEEEFEHKLNCFEIEVQKDDYSVVNLPVFYSKFTKGKFAKGDRVIVDGVVDIIDTKVCCIALSVVSLCKKKKK